ncbi:FG-GAP-like repeat-containing protein [Fulvivirga sp.]|uniref:FG-GAP-like repeat-containing protein n=1 Tax=Fulvivirga sp. TaxID=1931237 RepID=UPI0032EE7519
MNSLNQFLLRRLKAKHQKLSTRFLKGVEEGNFQQLTKRKRYTAVERLKKLERQLAEIGRRTDFNIKLSFKHWAVALALGVVVSTSAQAQEQKQPPKKFIEKIKAGSLNKGKRKLAQRTEAQTIFFNEVQQLGLPYSQNVHFGLVDGDADIDIVYVTYLGNPILFSNNGDRTFIQSELVIGDFGFIGASFLADFDGDGDNDLLLEYGQYGYTPTLSIWLNDGSGNFSEQTATIPVEIDEDDFLVADLDGDGDADLVMQDEYGTGIHVFINNAFSFEAVPGAPFSGPYSGTDAPLALADVDGDTDIDIVYQGADVSYNNGIRILENDGFGNFADAGTHSLISSYLESAAIGDFDNDGDADVVVTYSLYPDSQIVPFLNDGLGNFVVQSALTPPNASYPDDIFSVDLNADGFDDLIYNDESDSAFFYLGDGVGGFSNVGEYVGALLPGDFDTDGDPDFLIVTNNVAVLENQGSLTFVQDPTDVLNISYSYDIDLSDVDGDGDLDIVQGGSSRIWLNPGNGMDFTIGQDFEDQTEQQLLGDLDGDGDSDMIRIFDEDYGVLRGLEIWTNTGGIFSYHSAIGSGIFEPYGIELGDLDNDGDLDIVTVVRESSIYYVKSFINDGALGFSQRANVNLSSASSERLALGDLDGDTFIDVALANESYGVQILDNDGIGNLSLGQVISLSGPYVDIEDIHMADLDGDGDIDVLAVSSYEGYQGESYVLLNNGSGYLTDALQNVPTGGSYLVTLADMDIDGDVDLIASSYFSNNQLFINDGAANFTLDSDNALGVGDGYSAPQVGDLDGDGDKDVVIGGAYVATRVFLSTLNNASGLEADSLALVAFYDATNGDSWTDKTNWKTGDLDTWFGVTINTEDVTELLLPSNNIEGVIPAEFNSLTGLTSIDLSDNAISEIQTDLSGLTSLTSLNLSDNKLDFADFELLAGVPGLVVGAQTTDDVPLDQQLPAGSPISFSFLVDGTNNEYQWFKNGAILTDSTRNEIVIDAIGRDTQGLYYCEATNPNVSGLLLTSETKRVAATANVSGLLKLNETDPATVGEVQLLEIQNSGGYDTLDIATISGTGAYAFNNVVLSDYVLVGIVDTLTHPGAIPTYYNQTVFWADADTLKLEGNETIDIVSVFYTNPSDPVTFNGTFSGYLEEEIPDGGRTEARGRVSGAGVSLRRGRRTGRTNGTGELAYYIYTNSNGEFSLAGVEPGEYNVDIQYPGYPMDEASFLDITIGQEQKDKDINIEALVDQGIITVKQLIILGTDEPTNGLVLFPNPTSDFLNVLDSENRKNIKVEIFNMSGQKMSHIFINEDGAVNVSKLPMGQYLVKVKNQKGIELLNQRILIE